MKATRATQSQGKDCPAHPEAGCLLLNAKLGIAEMHGPLRHSTVSYTLNAPFQSTD